jgi:hypothetical protein
MKPKPYCIPGRLASRIGQSVEFGAPGDVKKAGGSGRRGTIVGEVWANPALNCSQPRTSKGPDDWGDYSFCAQRIRWEDGSHSIRLGYYRRRAGEDAWQWGSQTTVEGDPDEIKALCQNALDGLDWT